MDRSSKLFQLTLWLASSAIVPAGILGGVTPVRAQDAAALSADPPARVGRLARLEGTVSTHGAGSTQWSPAVLNFPVASGDSISTQPQAQADIEVGADLATLADNSELDLATLDDRNLVASEPQGALFLDLRDVRPGDTYTINTPRGAVQIAASGEYEILAGDANTPTRVAVVRGAAQLTSGALALRAGQGQMAVASGDQEVQGDVEPLTSYDPFLTAMLARNSTQANVPPAVQAMTGAQGLAQYGNWQQSPQYGQVWYPQVAPDWVPYRDGSWSYVAPWGWTWVDNEPWGFAPFHYGRWAEVDQRWCWVPNQLGAPEEAQPVYAPALVDFIAAGAVAGAAAGLLVASLSSGRGDIGWVPLGPREAYVPPYGGSSRYLRRLNWGDGWHRPSWGDRHDHNQVNNTTIVNRNVTNNFFINQHAMTVVPAAAMARSQQIRPVAHGIGDAHGGFQTAQVQPLRGPLPIRPVAETRGLTPQEAHRFGLAGGPAHAAPGPVIHPAALHPAAVGGGRIPFRQAPPPTGVHFRPAQAPGPATVSGPVVRPENAPHVPGRPPLQVRPAAPAAQPMRPAAVPPPPIPQAASGPPVFHASPPSRLMAPHFGAPQPQVFRPQVPHPVFPPRPSPPMQMQHPQMQQPQMQRPQMQRPMSQPHFEMPHTAQAPHAAPPSPARRPQ